MTSTIKHRTSNIRRHTPIPGLADHIAAFNAKPKLKSELAAIRAALADRIYAASEVYPPWRADRVYAASESGCATIIRCVYDPALDAASERRAT